MDKTICNVPVSIGELFDKYSILLIKQEKIQDNAKLDMVVKEINYLKPFILEYNLENSLFDELKQVNLTLWDIEDELRKKEQKKEFNNEFIELARSVYFTNDKRSEIKNKINLILNSSLNDIKSYVKYN
jgi:hypothetical protein